MSRTRKKSCLSGKKSPRCLLSKACRSLKKCHGTKSISRSHCRSVKKRHPRCALSKACRSLVKFHKKKPQSSSHCRSKSKRRRRRRSHKR